MEIWNRRAFFSQPGVFFPRWAYVEAGGLDVNLAYCMDRDLVTRLVRICHVVYLDRVLARARQHPASKTCSQSGDMVAESCAVARRYAKELRAESTRLTRWLLKAYVLRCAAGRVYHRAPTAVWPLLKELVRPRTIGDSVNVRGPVVRVLRERNM